MGVRPARDGEVDDGIYGLASDQLVGTFLRPPEEIAHRAIAARVRLSEEIQVLFVNAYAPVPGASDLMKRESKEGAPGFFERLGRWIESVKVEADRLWLSGDINVTAPGAAMDRNSTAKNKSQQSAGWSDLREFVLVPNELEDVVRKLDGKTPLHTCFTSTPKGTASSRIDVHFPCRSLVERVQRSATMPAAWTKASAKNEHYCVTAELKLGSLERVERVRSFRVSNRMLEEKIVRLSLGVKIQSMVTVALEKKPPASNPKAVRHWYDRSKLQIAMRVEGWQRRWQWKKSREFSKLLRALSRADAMMALTRGAGTTASARRRARVEFKLFVERNSELHASSSEEERRKTSGGKCSKAFFEKIKPQKRSPPVVELRAADGSVATTPAEICEAMRVPWGEVFASPTTGCPDEDREPDPDAMAEVLDSIPRKLSDADRTYAEEQCRKLATPEGEEDLKTALFALKLNKSPGSDGLTHEFWRHFWDEMYPLLREMIPACLELEAFSETMLLSWVRMLYKGKGDRTNPRRYRPIMLLNTDYKLIARALAFIFDEVIATLVNRANTAFSSTRQIDDSLLLLRAMYFEGSVEWDSDRTNLGRFLAQSTDIAAAYDSMKWPFMFAALKRMNFPPFLIKFIRSIYSRDANGVSRVKMVFMCAGQHSKSIIRGKGTFQGCPLSPVLFLIFASIMIDFGEKRLRGSGITLRAAPRISKALDSNTVSASMFVDDKVRFDVSSRRAATWSSKVMPTFSRASGLFTNPEKGVGVVFGEWPVEELKIEHFKSIAKWIPQSTQLRILGISFGANIEACRTFEDYLLSSSRRLAYFCSLRLSIQERARIVVALLDSIFVYAARASPPTAEQISTINRMNRLFLWANKCFGGALPGKPKHTALVQIANRSARVSLARLCLPYIAGGCGLLDIKAHFTALRVSYALKLVDPRHPVWKRMLRTSITDATKGWVRDEFLLLSTFSTSKLRSSGLMEPYWIEIVERFREVGVCRIEEHSFEEFMGMPLFYNTEVRAPPSRGSRAVPITPEPGAARKLAQFLFEAKVHTVGDLLEWNVAGSRYEWRSVQQIAELTAERRNERRETRASRPRRIAVNGWVDAQYRGLVEWLRTYYAVLDEQGKPKPIKPEDIVATRTSAGGRVVEALAEVVSRGQRLVRVGGGNVAERYLKVQPLTLYELGYFQSNNAKTVVIPLRRGEPEPPRVLWGSGCKRTPQDARHQGSFVAGVAMALPVHTEQWGFEAKCKVRRRDGDKKQEVEVVRHKNLAQARTKDLYRCFVPRPPPDFFDKLEDKWTELVGRRVCLRSVFKLTDPETSLINVFDRDVQWRIANFAIVTGETVARWGWDGGDASCPREQCGCERETLLHAFFECPVAREVWAWVARVTERLTGELLGGAAAPTSGATSGALRLVLRFDGSSRSAQGEGRGEGGGGALLYDKATGKVLWVGGEHLPFCTVNEGEYLGLTLALRAAVALGAHEVEVGGDSNLVIQQITGAWKVSAANLEPAVEECRYLLSRIERTTFRHVPREHNKAADFLANQAADGETWEDWADGPPIPTPSIRGRAVRGAPDAATCLLGVRRNFTKATLSTSIDWFQIMRMSALKHLSVTRTEARKGHHATEEQIKRLVAKDLVSRIQLRHAMLKSLGRLRIESVLRKDALARKYSRKRAADFVNISEW